MNKKRAPPLATPPKLPSKRQAHLGKSPRQVFLGIFMCSAALVVGNLLQDFILSDEDEEHRPPPVGHFLFALFGGVCR